MYLSRLVLNPRSRDVRRDLADCQELHRTVLAAFPARQAHNAVGARDEFGVLHRLEPVRRVTGPVLLVQSAEAPDWGRLPAGYLDVSAPAANPATTPLRPFLDSLQPGERLRFRLRANPTKKVDTKSGPSGERRNGRRVKLTTEAEQVAWLRRKAAEGGFEVLSVHMSTEGFEADVGVVDEGQTRGWRRTPAGRPRVLTFGAVLFDGHLRILASDAFARTVERGVGSGKAYGFGLLSVGRVNGQGE